MAAGAGAAWRAQAPAWLAALGFAPLPVADTPGLVVARTVAMLINEAADAVLQGVCSARRRRRRDEAGRELPRRALRVAGALERADGVVALLDALDAHYRGERYRVSPLAAPPRSTRLQDV